MALGAAARKKRTSNSHTKTEFWPSCHKYVLNTNYMPGPGVFSSRQNR